MTIESFVLTICSNLWKNNLPAFTLTFCQSLGESSAAIASAPRYGNPQFAAYSTAKVVFPDPLGPATIAICFFSYFYLG